MAAKEACIRIKRNLCAFAVQHFGVDADAVKFNNSNVSLGDKKIPFKEFISLAFLNRVELFKIGRASCRERV